MSVVNDNYPQGIFESYQKEIDELQIENKDLYKEYQDLAKINLELNEKCKQLQTALQNLIDAENLPFNQCCSECDEEYFSILNKRLSEAKQVIKEKDKNEQSANKTNL